MPPAYTEIDGSPAPKWSEDSKGFMQFDATRLLLCTWDDRVALLNYLYSTAGWSYPHADGTSEAIVRDVATKGFAKCVGSGSLMSYTYAILTVRYSTRGPRFFNNLLVEEYLKELIISSRVDPTKLFWDTGDAEPLEDNDAPRRDELGYVHELKVTRALTVPSDLLTYCGMCNMGTKTCATMPIYFPPQTVLYCPPLVSSHMAYDSTLRYTYIYRHLYKPSGWNQYWNPKTGTFVPIYKTGGTLYLQYPPTW